MAVATPYLAIPKLNSKPKPFVILNQSNATHNKPTSPKPSSSLRIPPQPTNEPMTTIAKNAAVLTTVISTLASSPPMAMAAKKIAESPEQDIRGLAFLVPIVPAVGWALVNILGPALNQIERMRVQRGLILGFGLGGLATAAAIGSPPVASAAEEAVSSGGNNGLFLAGFVGAAAFLEVVLLSSMLKKSESGEKRVTE